MHSNSEYDVINTQHVEDSSLEEAGQSFYLSRVLPPAAECPQHRD